MLYVYKNDIYEVELHFHSRQEMIKSIRRGKVKCLTPTENITEDERNYIKPILHKIELDSLTNIRVKELDYLMKVYGYYRCRDFDIVYKA
jgi:hypothetical protein